MNAPQRLRLGRRCPWCTAYLKLKALNNERLETPAQFNLRKFCNVFCWREWLAAKSLRSHAERAARRDARTVRRFSDGDPVWFVRGAARHHWLTAIPAEVEHYVNGRLSVRISALLPDGRSRWLTTKEGNLLPRAVAWSELMSLQRMGIPPAAVMPADTESVRAEVHRLLSAIYDGAAQNERAKARARVTAIRER